MQTVSWFGLARRSSQKHNNGPSLDSVFREKPVVYKWQFKCSWATSSQNRREFSQYDASIKHGTVAKFRLKTGDNPEPRISLPNQKQMNKQNGWKITAYFPPLFFIQYLFSLNFQGFPGGSNCRVCIVGDPGSVPGSGRSPGSGNSYPLQYSCLENSMDRGAWQTTVHGVAKRQTQLSN